MLLDEFLEPLSISQAELARRLEKPAAAINEIVKGKRGISAEMAWRLSEEFGTTPFLWMNLQMHWDLWHARQALARRKRR
jgi:antitoxin HigA-1